MRLSTMQMSYARGDWLRPSWQGRSLGNSSGPQAEDLYMVCLLVERRADGALSKGGEGTEAKGKGETLRGHTYWNTCSCSTIALSHILIAQNLEGYIAWCCMLQWASWALAIRARNSPRFRSILSSCSYAKVRHSAFQIWKVSWRWDPSWNLSIGCLQAPVCKLLTLSSSRGSILLMKFGDMMSYLQVKLTGVNSPSSLDSDKIGWLLLPLEGHPQQMLWWMASLKCRMLSQSLDLYQAQMQIA